MVDTQCDKLAMAIGRTKLTTLATINVPQRKKQKNLLSSSEFGTPLQREVLLVLKIPETVEDKWRVDCVPKTSLIHTSVLIELQHVTDGQTDTRSSRNLLGILCNCLQL